MLKILPILLLALVTGLAMWFFSSWRLRRVLDESARPLTDPVLGAHVAGFARLLDLPALQVHVFETSAINGLAAPDGRIFITRGFLDRYRRGEVSSAELASVIAHELGHVALGHYRRRMIDFTGQNVVRVMLAVILGRFLPFIGIWIADLLATVIAARLSRRDEYEADEWAAALLTKAGIGTAPQKSMFRKLAAMVPAAGMPAWLMSHPRIEERIAAIEALERRWSIGVAGESP
ncbi:MAG TPA: M48 family metallopeptidase [Paracoccaceae bacterium]|nr:M48 family metallopeptidase [Paracoccaceae bacterium]